VVRLKSTLWALPVEKFSSLEVEKKLQTYPLLRERIEHLTQSVKSVLGEGLSRRVCHTVPDTVSLGLGMQDLFALAIADRGIYPVRNDMF